MKTKILILFAIIAVVIHGLPLQAQEQLPDILWSTDFSVRIAKFSPDGQYVYFVKNNDLTNLYRADAMTGEISGTFTITQRMFDFDFSTSSDTLVVLDGLRLFLWNTQKIDTVKIISVLLDSLKAKQPPKSIKFTRDGKQLIVVKGEEPKIVIIDIETEQIIKEIFGKDASGLLDVSPDGEFFVFEYYANGWRNYIDIIDLNTYENLGTLENFIDNTNYNHLAIPDNNIIVSCGYQPNYLYLWDIKTKKLIKTHNFDLPDFGDLIKFAVTKDSKFVMVANDFNDDKTKNRISVFDLEKEKIIYTYPYGGSNLDISSDGYILSRDIYVMRMLNPTWMKYIGVKEIKKEEKIKHTFFNGILRIFFDEEIFEIPEIYVYNILGVETRCPDFIGMPVQNGNEIEMDLNHLQIGIYFVQISVNAKTYIIKINIY